MTTISSQDEIDAARLQSVPVESRSIRERQLAAAKEQGVDLVFRDKGRVAETTLRGVPVSVSSIEIATAEQLAPVMESLYPLFGFGTTERFVYLGKAGNTYNFSEEINGHLVEPSRLSVVIGPDQKIAAIRGTAVINQNFGVDHALDAQGAMQAVQRYVQGDETAQSSSVASAANATLIYKHWDEYRSLALWWIVQHGGSDFYVDPNGSVSSAVTVTP